MQFSTFAVAALSMGTALAQGGGGQVAVHVVTVGNANGSLVYSPDNIIAAKGDMVQFQFLPKNHTVTQSNFDNPCEPLDLHSNITGVFSGFMPVAATDANQPTFTILINATTPMWLYCSQGKHCQNGMSMVINQNTKANASRSLEAYQAAAKNAKANLVPSGGPADGTAGTTSAQGTSTGSAGSASTSSSTSTTSSAGSKATGSATTTKAPAALSLAGLLAVGFALFL